MASDNEQQKAELRRLFAKRLPAKLQQLAVLVDRILAHPDPASQIKALSLHLDTSMRSCESFGFDEVVQLLQQLSQAAEHKAFDLVAECNQRLHERSRLGEERPAPVAPPLPPSVPALAPEAATTTAAAAPEISVPETPPAAVNVEAGLLEGAPVTLAVEAAPELEPAPETSAEPVLIETTLIDAASNVLDSVNADTDTDTGIGVDLDVDIGNLDPLAIPAHALHPLLLALSDNDDRVAATRALALFGFAAQASFSAGAGADTVAAIVSLDKLAGFQGHLPEELPIIAIADEDSIAVRVDALRLGADALLTRPLDISALVQTLEHVAPAASSEPPRVLIVDDSRSQSHYYNKVLVGAGCITKVVNAPLTIEGALLELQPELILLDMQMPGCSGLELARVLKQMPSWAMTPVVFLSAEENPDKQKSAMAVSGDDFLIKPVEAEALKTAVLKRISRARAQHQWLSRDGLTGVANRSALMQELEVQCALAGRTNEPFTYVQLDVDAMATYNESHSYPAGDKLLQQLARLLKRRIRTSDGLGRTAGDAFGMILRNCLGENASRLFDSIRSDFLVLSGGANFSCGIVTYNGAGHIALRDSAAAALKRAKAEGGRRNHFI